MKRKIFIAVLSLTLTVIVSGCSNPVQNSTPTPTNAPIETIVPTNTMTPTATSTPVPKVEPTATVAPTATSTPIPTVELTSTPAPTVTLKPTATTAPTVTPTPTIIAEDSKETKKAKELGLVPASWSNNMMAKTDFVGYYDLLCNLVKLCDESSMTNLETLINNKNFPDRDINRDDALMMLFLTAEALGYNKQNARSYGFCTENEMNFDLANSQIS